MEQLEERLGVIYRATNLVNRKCYVGKTIKSFEKRALCHRDGAKKDDKTNNKFANALRKYPNESDWKWEVIYKDIPESQLDVAEMCAIYTNDSVDNGYNGTFGGDGGHKTEFTKQKISESMKILWHDPVYRKMISEHKKIAMARPEVHRKICENNKRLWQDSKYRKKVSIRKKIAMSKPECIKVRSDITKKLWQNEIYREKVLKSKRSQGAKDSGSIKMKKHWQNPEYREKMLLIMNDPENVKKRSEKIREAKRKNRELRAFKNKESH